MKVAIHQPNYLPWIGYFCKMNLCDVFIVLDNVEYPKNGIVNRNKIRVKNGWNWITVPIERKYYGTPINGVRLPEDDSWWKKHWNAILANYSKSEFFYENSSFFENLYMEKKYKMLQELNEFMINFIANKLDIHPKIIRASEMDLDFNLKKTDLIIDILSKCDCKTYFSGMGGKGYLVEKSIFDAGIDLKYFVFESKQYSQRWPGFEPYMSVIDLLFNLGSEKSIDTLNESTHIKDN
ncbi:MAG: hypothetical protein APR63_01570 [Desulfuromonas sp. SDB]|nr:MAG: hypothetical protein APR63_01570 [Desulfuromonas sp. SDB]